MAFGVADNGGVIEVLTARAGATWTILLTLPSGVSCLIAAGENVEIFNAAGGIQIANCHNLPMHNRVVDALPHFGDSFGYGIFVGGQSSNIQISNFTAYETRHAFTTLSGQVGADFWGGPRDIVLTNCYGANSLATRESTQALAIWDTHEFGKKHHLPELHRRSGDRDRLRSGQGMGRCLYRMLSARRVSGC